MNEISFASGSLGKVPVLEEVLGNALSEVDTGSLLDYLSPLGMVELREQVAGLYGSNLTAENVMITSSAQQGLVITFDHLLSFGMHEVAAQEPAYFGVLRILGRESSVNVMSFENIDESKEVCLLLAESPENSAVPLLTCNEFPFSSYYSLRSALAWSGYLHLAEICPSRFYPGASGYCCGQ